MSRVSIVACLLFTFFLSGSKSAYAVPRIDCNSPSNTIGCAEISGGSVYYYNSRYTADIDLERVEVGVLHLLNVNIQGWDLSTYGTGFTVTAAAGVDYDLPKGHFYMFESDGDPTTSGSGTEEKYITNDPVADDFGAAYLVLQIDGTVTQSTKAFLNHGETVIGEGGKYINSDTPNDDNFLYSDVLSIGGSGGVASDTVFTISTFNFSVNKMSIENATFDLSNAKNIYNTGVDKEINLYGNTEIGLHSVALHSDEYLANVDFNVEGDNNVINLDAGSEMIWYAITPSMSDYQGYNLYVTCSTTCTGNAINLVDKKSQIDFSEVILQDVAEFHVNTGTDGTYDMEHLKLINSNMIINVDNGSQEFSLITGQSTYVPAGEAMIDANSSLTVNATADSVIHFHGTTFVVEGDLTLNLTDNSTFATMSDSVYISATKGAIFNFTDSIGDIRTEFNLTGGSVTMNAYGASIITFFSNVIGGGGEMTININNNSLVYFEIGVLNISAPITINQMVYLGGAEQTLLRFDNVNMFLDDDVDYYYSMVSMVKDTNFTVHSLTTGSVVVIQIKNDGPPQAFPYEMEVSNKIVANSGGSSGGDGGLGGSSFSVLITFEGVGGATGSSLIGYETINTVEYADFGISGVGGTKIKFHKAQDQYGEDEGLLTLTTTENMNGYGVAVTFDNIILSSTDREPYRLTLFNLVINNSRTVEQLGQTLDSLSANMTLSNILYSNDILNLGDKKNTAALLDGERFAAYAEVKALSNNNFDGKYLVFGASLMLYQSPRYRFGISGFFSPYTSSTLYDGAEKSNNVGASAFWAIQVGKYGNAVMFDASFMNSAINGTAIEDLSSKNKRQYSYNASSASATASYNFGFRFSQRLLVSAFVSQPSNYVEDPSDLALHVTTPSYYNAFVGYYSRLLNSETFIFELGVKYYFKEGQKGGTAGFVNDPEEQEWGYQYILLDNPVEISTDLIYRVNKNLEVKTSLNHRGNYNNFGFYIMYKEAFSVKPASIEIKNYKAYVSSPYYAQDKTYDKDIIIDEEEEQ